MMHFPTLVHPYTGKDMFFRREKPRSRSFEDHKAALKSAGFGMQADGSGKAHVQKYGCAAILEDRGTEAPRVRDSGVVAGSEVANLVNAGYQQFFVTPSGKRLPALAEQLRALHDFQEDLKEALGLTSLYNTSLGTVSNRHLYDRVKDRDKGGSPAPVR
jgi:hypothetical protein